MSASVGRDAATAVRLVPESDDWDAHVEELLSSALDSWRDERDPGTLLELAGMVIAAIGRRAEL